MMNPFVRFVVIGLIFQPISTNVVCGADPPMVSLPKELSTPPGRLLKIPAETVSPMVRWYLATDGADLLAFPDGKSAVFVSPKAGRFVVLAWTAAGDVPSELAQCIVQVGEAVPPSPPESEFVVELRKRFAADLGEFKATHAAQLASVYRDAVKLADRPELRTVGELAAKLRQAVAGLLPANALLAVRQRIAEEIAAELPIDTDTPLSPESRARAAKRFALIATALEGVK